jgi:hypothetical protein
MALRPHGLPSRICPPAIATCRLPCVYLAGGHRNSVELRPSRNPSLKSSETMPSWGRRCQPTARALRRCAAYVATTFYSLLSLPLCCLLPRQPLHRIASTLVGASIHCARTRTAHTLTSHQSLPLFRSKSVHFR